MPLYKQNKFMNNKLQNISQLIREGQLEIAAAEVQQLLADPKNKKAELYYLQGNICRKRADWQNALNNYQEAIALDPESPAVNARRMILDILEFYNKDMFNQ